MKDQENLFESGNSNKNDTAVNRYSTHIRNLCKLTSFLKREYKTELTSTTIKQFVYLSIYPVYVVVVTC